MRLIMQVKYVIKRGSIYYFKFNIPRDCRDCFQGRTEIQKSLKTDDILDAKEQAEKLGKIWAGKIARARTKNKSIDSSSTPSMHDIDSIAEEFRVRIAPYIQKHIDSCLSKPNAEIRKTLNISLENSIGAYQKCILAGTYTDQELINLINPFAEKDQFALDACTEAEPRGVIEDDVLTGVARRIVPIILDGLLELKEKIEQELYSSEVSGAPGRRSPTSSTRKISDVLDEMLRSTHRAEKTDFNIRANVQLLIEWLGDIPIQCIKESPPSCDRSLPNGRRTRSKSMRSRLSSKPRRANPSWFPPSVVPDSQLV